MGGTGFCPTMISIAGGQVPDYMQGISFERTLQVKRQVEQREEAYYRYWMHIAHYFGNPAHFGIRTKRY